MEPSRSLPLCSAPPRRASALAAHDDEAFVVTYRCDGNRWLAVGYPLYRDTPSADPAYLGRADCDARPGSLVRVRDNAPPTSGMVVQGRGGTFAASTPQRRSPAVSKPDSSCRADLQRAPQTRPGAGRHRRHVSKYKIQTALAYDTARNCRSTRWAAASRPFRTRPAPSSWVQSSRERSCQTGRRCPARRSSSIRFRPRGTSAR